MGWTGYTWGRALLTFDEVLKNGGNSVGGLSGPTDVLMSPDSLYVYTVSSFGSEVGLFRREKASGTLVFIEEVQDNLSGVDGIGGAIAGAISPEGKHLYIAGNSDDAIAVFSRNITSGQLTFVEFRKDDIAGIDGLNGAASVSVSADGNHVYIVGYFDDALVVFARNATTGELTFVESLKDELGGVDGLNGADAVAISPDDKHVYIAGNIDDAVAVFSRNSTTGQLTFVEVHKDGANGVDGLNGATDITISPDGNHAYVAGNSDNAVAVFSRNTTTGALTFIEVHLDDIGGVDGLISIAALTVSPDNEHVYTSSNVDDAVAVFNRNTATGTLSFVEAEFDAQGGGVDGINGASSVLVVRKAHIFTPWAA